MFAQSKGGNYSSTNNGASGVADAIDFDGATDYLSRSSDLVGNADGKAFTFSVWVWRAIGDTQAVYEANVGAGATDDRVQIRITGNLFQIICRNATGTMILRGESTVHIPYETWTNVLLSFDLSSASLRHMYVNDIKDSGSWPTYATTETIDFTTNKHLIAADDYNATKLKNRLAHIFLDYQYRDLSITANRRLFVTADRKPAANQAALNPILYLPLSDPTQPGKNLGTGGDFALNGVVARSGRGPSQFNAPYSKINGSSGQHMVRTSALAGIADSKQVTLAFCIMPSSGSALDVIQLVSNTSSFRFRCYMGEPSILYVMGYNSSATKIFGIAIDTNSQINNGRNCTVVISFDLSDVAKRHCYLNGISVSSYDAYSDQSIDFACASPTWGIGINLPDGRKSSHTVGNVFFDTRYIDLSQPANLAKFVTGTGIDAKPADLGANGEKPFGTPPLIYLPMYGNNAGKNYGTGGDFTVNSGPFTGARGPNEFWGNKADFDGSTGYLARTSALTGVGDGKTFSCSFWVGPDAISTKGMLFTIRKVSGVTLIIQAQTSTGSLSVSARNSDNVTILSGYSSIFGTDSDRGRFINISIDLTDAAKRFIYVDGVNTCTWLTYTNDSIFLSAESVLIGNDGGADYLDGKLSEFYFTTDYIDFSQEANRLKFRDAFGNPVDLRPQIAAGTLPNPAIYMRFDPANFGKNEGYGGNFTPVGKITDGGQL